jgi:hypothetical protein
MEENKDIINDIGASYDSNYMSTKIIVSIIFCQWIQIILDLNVFNEPLMIYGKTLWLVLAAIADMTNDFLKYSYSKRKGKDLYKETYDAFVYQFNND